MNDNLVNPSVDVQSTHDLISPVKGARREPAFDQPVYEARWRQRCIARAEAIEALAQLFTELEWAASMVGDVAPDLESKILDLAWEIDTYHLGDAG